MGHLVNPLLYRLKYTVPFNVLSITKKKYSSYFDLKINMIYNFIKLFFFNFNKDIFKKALVYVLSLKVVFKYYNLIVYLSLKQSKYLKKIIKRKIRFSKRLISRVTRKANVVRVLNIFKLNKNFYSEIYNLNSKLYFFKSFNVRKIRKKKILKKKIFAEKNKALRKFLKSRRIMKKKRKSLINIKFNLKTKLKTKLKKKVFIKVNSKKFCKLRVKINGVAVKKRLKENYKGKYKKRKKD